MKDKSIQLDWNGLNRLTEEVIAPDGPGSAHWQGEGSYTQRLNDALMAALRENSGIVPGELAEVPLMILTTTGSVSGKPRAVPLAWLDINGRFVVIASMGGAADHPPWFKNIRANPAVGVEVSGRTYRATASILTGADRDEMFAEVCAQMPVFGDYQKRTERTIPVVELIPAA